MAVRHGPERVRIGIQADDDLGFPRAHARIKQVAEHAATIDPPMPFQRAAWLATVLVALLTGLLVGLAGYTGYGLLCVAVAISAAINLR